MPFSKIMHKVFQNYCQIKNLLICQPKILTGRADKAASMNYPITNVKY
jgi:hypothetical protein